MKKLAIIGAETMACNYAINAREMGVETHCFAYEKGAIAKDIVDNFYPISIFETDRIIAKCREVGVNGVVATTELTVHVAAHVARQLGLNCIDPTVASRLTDKYFNREAAKEVVGLNQPGYCVIRSREEAGRINLKFPLILKPIAEGGKRGITVVYSIDELSAAIEYAASESKRGYEIIVEEFLPEGIECSVETLSYHNKHMVIQVTEKISSGPPHCVELGHIQPARIRDEMRRKVEEVIPRMLTALGYDNGPSHTEIKIVGGRIYLIECNTRPGGDFITYPLVNLSTGYYHLKGAIQIALDEFAFPNRASFEKSCAGVCFVTDQTRFLASVFAVCQEYPWCYRKHEAGPIEVMNHNNCDGTNYFIWHDKIGMPQMIGTLLNRGKL